MADIKVLNNSPFTSDEWEMMKRVVIGAMATASTARLETLRMISDKIDEILEEEY